MEGLFASAAVPNPTLVNNVETLANVPSIVGEGANWLRREGTESSPGTMCFTVCGDVEREGVFELPLGTPLRHLVSDLAGARSVKVIFPGASSAVIVADQLDLAMDFDVMRAAGTGVGAGGFFVLDQSACIVRAARGTSRASCGSNRVRNAPPASSGPATSPRSSSASKPARRMRVRWTSSCSEPTR
jgi:NADH:ubiquinone oxidoreductase subunit F (NADH-binding)